MTPESYYILPTVEAKNGIVCILKYRVIHLYLKLGTIIDVMLQHTLIEVYNDIIKAKCSCLFLKMLPIAFQRKKLGCRLWNLAVFPPVEATVASVLKCYQQIIANSYYIIH